MEVISLEQIKIPANYVLIKPDPDHEFVKIKPESEFSAITEEVEIKIGYTSETHARHYGITGTVLVAPQKLVYNGYKIKKFKNGIINNTNREIGDQIRMSQLNQSSISYDVDMDLKAGDKIWFSYLCQINSVTDQLIIDVKDHGLCFLCKYDELYGYERDGELNLINGWIWIQQLEKDKETATGLAMELSDDNKFETGVAYVVKTSKAIKAYLDGVVEDQIELYVGDKILYNHKMGHSMEYAMHRSLTDQEVLSIRRKNIIGVL